VKTLHRPRLLLAMAALSIVAPLLGGIVVEVHLPGWCLVCSSGRRFPFFVFGLVVRGPAGRRGRQSGGSESSPPPSRVEVFVCRPWFAWATGSSASLWARPWGRRGCRSGGSGCSPPLCCVEVLWCRLWSLGWLSRRLVWGRGLGAGVVRCVVWFFGRFPL
jgi:hypothetical protein